MDIKLQEKYYQILRKELVCAQGCTEPIAIAFASAKAREVLGALPDKIAIGASGNIIKNVKSVVIPNTGNMVGLKAAAVVGAVGGNAELELEVLRPVTAKDLKKARELLRNPDYCTVSHLKSEEKLHILLTQWNGSDTVSVEIKTHHTNIVKITKNGNTLFENDSYKSEDGSELDYDCLSVEGIYEFALNGNLDPIRDVLENQINCNVAISNDGLKHVYGANVGKVLQRHNGETIQNRARYRAAAGSDARMNGCLLPVVINSGSGNQGITVTLPVVSYCEYMGKTHEECLRALAMSNLISIHEKHQIGSLSAFCGAVTAACGSGAAITYLKGGSLDRIEMTITNALANMSGLFCDGAKSSCAAKIASAVDAAIMASEMAEEDCVFQPGEGIVDSSIETTISNIGRIGAKGMEEVDNIVLDIMVRS